MSLLTSVVLVVGFRLGPAGVMTGQLVGSALGIAVAIVVAGGIARPALNSSDIREMLRFSLPLVPSSLGVIVLIATDRIVVSQATGLGDVGVFGVGYRVAQVVGILMGGLQLALTPLIYERYLDPTTPSELARIFRIFVAGALVLWVGLSAFASLLIAVLATDRYVVAAPLVPLLSGVVILTAAQVFAPGLSLAKRTGVIAATNIGGAACNIVLSVALVPQFGLVAAAASTLAATALVFALNVSLGQRSYPVPFDWARVFTGLAVATALVIAVQGIAGWTWSEIVIRMAVVGTAAASCVAVGLIRRSDLVTVFGRHSGAHG